MSRWDIFRWRTLAGGRWCPVGTVQRRPRRQRRPAVTSHWDVTALFQKAPPLRPFAPKLAYFSGFMCTSSWG